MIDIFEQLIAMNRQGRICVLVTVVEKTGHGPGKCGFKMLLTEAGEIIGTVGGGQLEYMAIETAGSVIRDKSNLIKTYQLGEGGEVQPENIQTKMVCGGTTTLFYEYIAVDETVYIFGGGHIGDALIHHLKGLKFCPVLVDNRIEILEKFTNKIPAYLDMATLCSERGLAEKGYFVIATHSHDIDFKILEAILEAGCDPQYIGIIASRKKSQLIFEKIRKNPDHAAYIPRISSPIGLNIGGDNAHEIAVSIIAEMQAIKYDKKDLAWK